jgi:cytidylate kinase
MIITIDGPSGGGKSSLARAIAEKYHLHHLATSLLYRAVGFVLSRRWDEQGQEYHWQALSDLDYAEVDKILYHVDEEKVALIYEGEDITPFLSDENIAHYASQVSTDARLRARLLIVQRKIGSEYDLVADGRDVGSVVFPDADLKLFLTATPEMRAQRMLNDVERWKSAKKMSYQECLANVQERDARDQNRAVAPLMVPEGAVVIDATNLSFEQVKQQVFKLIEDL